MESEKGIFVCMSLHCITVKFPQLYLLLQLLLQTPTKHIFKPLHLGVLQESIFTMRKIQEISLIAISVWRGQACGPTEAFGCAFTLGLLCCRSAKVRSFLFLMRCRDAVDATSVCTAQCTHHVVEVSSRSFLPRIPRSTAQHRATQCEPTLSFHTPPVSMQSRTWRDLNATSPISIFALVFSDNFTPNILVSYTLFTPPCPMHHGLGF